VTARQYPFNPEAEYDASSDFLFGNNGEGSLALRLTQEFETGHQRKFRGERAQAGVLAEESAVRNTERLLEADVTAAFYAGVQLQRKVGLADAALELARKSRDLAERRLAAKDLAEVQVLPLRLEAVRAEGEVQRRRRDAAAAKILLLSVLGEEPRTDFDLVGDLPGPPPVALEEPRLRRRMIDSRPDLNELRHRVEEAEAAVRLEESERSPDVRLGVGFERSTSQLDVGSRSVHDRDNLIGISVSVPLPLFNKRAGEIAEANAEVRLNRAELGAREWEAIASLSAALERLRASTERSEFYRDRLLPVAETTLEATRTAFEAGEVSTVEVLQAQDRLRALREEYQDALFEVAAARNALEAAVGAPLEDAPKEGKRP
jgi:cobalt-zinc-cadmium efflux system outer membrane protein